MTEEEAKTKWCPFARVVPGKLSQADMVLDGAPHAHNRVQEVGAADATWHAAMNCIGAACMAWQWTEFNLSDFNEPALPVGGKCGLSRP